jgi:mono/diheme cytochrome c family protein
VRIRVLEPNRLINFYLASLWLSAPLFSVNAVAANVDYQRDIRPLLARKCLACHGPDQQGRRANLRLDSRETAIGAQGHYPAIVPGKSRISRAVIRVTHPTKPMPPQGERLTQQEVDLLAKWIDEGAPYSRHWAFEPPKQVSAPLANTASWNRTEIDRWVFAALQAKGWSVSPEAKPETLARRVAFDLTGLPPDQMALREFLNNPSPEGYERFVDGLLASPHYGERWARVWMDLARYADTQGFQHDFRRSIWPWRDWVIRAFNNNVRFDRFTILQLAGDLLPSTTQEDLIATGFHRNTLTNNEGGTDDEEYRDQAVRDRAAVTGQVWMGITVGCAQCHDHKYDPISQRDFYRLYAFFNQTEDADRNDDAPRLPLTGGASTLILRELPAERQRVTRIFERGAFTSPGAVVDAGVPGAFHPFPENAPKNRLGLAQWLVDPRNPLTARVQVNRFWSRLFGRGLVESEEDFGTQGAAPSHPELLDYLEPELCTRLTHGLERCGAQATWNP